MALSCLPGASQAVQLILSCLLGASLVPPRVSNWLFPTSLVPRRLSKPPWYLASCPINPFLPPWFLAQKKEAQRSQEELNLPGFQCARPSLVKRVAVNHFAFVPWVCPPLSKFQWRPARFVANPRVDPTVNSNLSRSCLARLLEPGTCPTLRIRPSAKP